jgi:FAD/FMN-containing dehydrogenase
MNAETFSTPFRLTDEQVQAMFPGGTERFGVEAVQRAIATVEAIAEAIRDLGGVPSGHLYVGLMDKLSLNMYQGIVAKLKQAGLVSEAGHYLTWIGPKA